MILYSIHHISTQHLRNFIRGGSAPRSNSLPFYIPFLAKKTYPFRLPSFDKWCPFYGHIFPSLEPCIPFNYCKCTFFKVWINLKQECFLDFFTATNASLIPFGSFSGPRWQNSLPFHTLQLVKSVSFHMPVLEPKKVPLSEGASAYRPS